MSNVHKFIAEKGIEEAKRVLENAPVNAVELRSNGLYYSSSGLYWCNVNKQFFESLNPNKFLAVNLSELKRVVYNIEIVQGFDYGISEAKSFLCFLTRKHGGTKF